MSRRLALLISNDQYSDANLTKLAAPLADAEALASVLRDPAIGAFDDVQTVVNQPSADVRHAIADFFHSKQPTDLLLLYFSGHGLRDGRDLLYLATPDSDIKLPRARSVDAAYIAQEMDESRSKRQVLILDCCFSGAFRQGITKSSVGQPVQTEAIFNGDGRVVLAACDATQYAFEGDTLVGQGVRSVFTHYLVEGLTNLNADANGDGLVTVDELYDYLQPRVTAHTPTQTPVKWNYKQRGIFVLAGQKLSDGATTLPTPIVKTHKASTYRTWIVDQMHRGDFTTISEAITAAKAGDKIVIHRGFYEEGLIIDKPLELEGSGDVCDVVIQTSSKEVLLFATSRGQVRNLTLRLNGGNKWDCVDIIQGSLSLEYCDITSIGRSCISIHNGANPMIRNNRIHNGEQGGICVYDQGQGIIEKNEIFANAYAGIEICKDSNPIVRNNRIYDGRDNGIYVNEQGQGVIEENEIFTNAEAGIAISERSNPTVRNNRIHSNKENGIFVYEMGQGTIEGNDIFDNAEAGIEISKGSNPLVRKNRIYDNKENGIYITEQGQGLIEENEIFANAYAGIGITSGGNPVVRNNRIHKGESSGVYVYELGQGLIEGNDIFANAEAGIEISEGSNPTIHNNHIRENESSGINVYELGQGVIEENDIFENTEAGIEISEGGSPTVCNNRINMNGYAAIWIREKGKGHFENNDLCDNQRGAWDIDRDCYANITRAGNIQR